MLDVSLVGRLNMYLSFILPFFQIEWAPRFGGLCIAQLIEYIQYHPTKPVPPEKMHTIGYSVGAHILGLAANYISEGKIGRITGNKYMLHT